MLHRSVPRLKTLGKPNVAKNTGNIETEPLPPNAKEAMRIVTHRIAKAERDERMDITLALTPPKTLYETTRDTGLQPGGRYHQSNRQYDPPPPEAYKPHTVFLLEARQGIGHTRTLDHIIEICREGDFEAVLRMYNSKKAPQDALECMDNALWPWLSQKGIHCWKANSEGARNSAQATQRLPQSDDEHEIPARSNPSGAPPRDAVSAETVEANAALQSTTHTNLDDSSSVAFRRAQYLPTLDSSPFFRPLLTLTFPTRPLALSVARLSRVPVHGLPFHALLSSDARSPTYTRTPSKEELRKVSSDVGHPLTYTSRLRCLRLMRMLQVSTNLAELLLRARGGLVPVRFDPSKEGDDTGKVSKPSRPEDRTICVGAWYKREAEIRQDYEEASQSILKRFADSSRHFDPADSSNSFVVCQLDDHGRRYKPNTSTPVPWSPVTECELPPAMREYLQMERRLLSLTNMINTSAKSTRAHCNGSKAPKTVTAEKTPLASDPPATLQESETKQHVLIKVEAKPEMGRAEFIQLRKQLLERMADHLRAHLYTLAFWKVGRHRKVVYPQKSDLSWPIS
ncbi:hypothetical protein AX17_002245 [Amanita inopinata Kibby_2008]|nr:hypothetical protein AX17_002245 [Amanita inopinata Kibby_2008]